MTRSPTEEPAKISKRKGTRSVSTLTPSQLARKRANDREAQRAIRARTKEHIERLERELEQLRRYSNEDKINDLLRKNAELERQVAELRGVAAAANIRPNFQQSTGYNVDAMSHAGSGVSSRASSFGHGSGEYNAAAGSGFSYLPTPEPCETWPMVPVSGVSVPSVVSSPCSSTGHPDDYVPGYIPTSMPASMMSGAVVPGGTSMPCLEDNKVEFEELDTSTTTADQGYSQPNVAHTPTAYMQQPQPGWPMYSSGSGYFSQSPTI